MRRTGPGSTSPRSRPDTSRCYRTCMSQTSEGERRGRRGRRGRGKEIRIPTCANFWPQRSTTPPVCMTRVWVMRVGSSMLFGWGDAALRNLHCVRAFASAQEQGAANGLQGSCASPDSHRTQLMIMCPETRLGSLQAHHRGRVPEAASDRSQARCSAPASGRMRRGLQAVADSCRIRYAA